MGAKRASRRIVVAMLGVIAAIAGLAIGTTTAQAATPTILNTGNWLENLSSVGETNNSGNRVWLSLAVKHDVGRKVTGIKIDDDWNGTDNTTSKTVKTVTAQQPTIQGGYDHSRISYNYQFPTSDTGLSCGAFGVGGTNETTKQIRVRAVLDNGDETATSSKDIDFSRADCSGGEDFPYLYQRSQTATSINTGQSVTFTFRGDDSDSNGNADFAGINWRLRRSSDGATTTAVKRCYSSPFDNTDKTLPVTFNDRGRWIVEAELLNNSGCNVNNHAGSWTYIGAVDVNSPATSSPTASLSATRPQINGTSTVTATFADGSDSGEGGRVQNAEWDLDNNTTNGVGGFEIADLGTWNANLSSPRSKTVNTSGMTPGLKTVRVRVGDNGALVGADTIRRTTIATTTYLVDTPPVATGQSINARSGTPKEVTFAGTDVDDDALTFAVTDQPAHGTVTGSGANATYTADPGYAGTDSFTFTANDGFGGTDVGTVTVDVAPSTTIDEPTPTAVATGDVEFTFSSPVAGTAFECRLDPSENSEWEACESPYTATGLSEGPHYFQARATVGGVTDPSPASHTVTVYLTPPDTTIDGGPEGPTSVEDPTFTFSSNVDGSTFECLLDTGDSNNQWESCASPKVYDDLIDGVYTFNVRATDPAGNIDGDPASVNFSIDNTAPDTTIDSTPAAVSNQGDPTFEFSSSEFGAEFECRLDAGDWDPCVSPKTFQNVGAGSHDFAVRALDALGNRDATPATFTWNVDLAEPAVSFTSTPAAITNESGVEFGFEADETVDFECSTDGGDWEACSSPATVSVTTDGDHTFQVRGTDGAGNVGVSPEFSWELDRVGPDTFIDSEPAPIVNQASVQFVFSSDEEGTFECRLDSADWGTCASPADYSALVDGTHGFEVRATDLAGNSDGTPASSTFTVDTETPDLSIDSSPDEVTNSPNAEFTFTSSDLDATFECRLDGSGNDPFEACESPKSYLGLDEGAHVFEVRATDQAGNRSDPETFEWSIDITAPVTTITGHPADPTQSGSAAFEFESDGPGNTFECRLDSADEGDWSTCESPVQYTGLSEARHKFEVRGIDQLGNVAAEAASWSWTVDQTAPVAQFLTTPPQLDNQTTVSFGFTADEPGQFECRLDSSDAADWQSCASPRQVGSLGEGVHTFQVRVTDAAGNAGVPISHEWEVDLTAPVASIDSQPDEFTNETTASFDITANDGEATLECDLDGSGWEACATTVTYSSLGEGEHTFRVRATDEAGNTGPAASHTWRIILTPPTATIDQGPEGPGNSADVNFTFSSNDDQADFECRLDSQEESAWQSCASPKSYTGLGEGDHTFELKAIDGLGNESTVASRQFSIDVTAPAVTIDDAPGSPSMEASADFEFSSADAAATFECSLDGAPFAACESPEQVTGLDEGQHTFRVRATDQVENTGAVAEHIWRVDLTKPVVTIDQAPETLTNSPDATFEFSADEPGQTECRIDSDDEADWESCDSPRDLTGLTEGEHRFEVRATDDAGNASEVVSHVWSIDLTAPAATIAAAPDALTNQATASFEFSSNDPDATFECRLDSSQADAWESCESPRNLTALADGAHAFEVRAIDEAGNVGAAETHEWTVDLGVPTASINSAPEVLNNETTAVFEFASDDEEATFECRIDGGANGEWEDCVSPAGYSNLAAGQYTFRVRATDAAGNMGQEANHSWTVDLTAPVVTIGSAPAANTNSTEAEFEFGSDKQGTTYECRIDSDEDAAWESCDSPASFTGLEDGSHLFEVRGTDLAANTAVATHEWSIDTEVPVATIDSAPDETTNRTVAVFEFSADKAGTIYECRLNSEDSDDWAACETGQSYSGLEDGAQKFELRPTDPLGNVGEVISHEWTIDTVLPQVTIQTGPQQMTSQKSAEFTFTADKPGSTFECRVDGAGQAGWADCDSGVSYTALADGDHTFQVRATDVLGNLGEVDEWAWTVDSVVPVAEIGDAPAGMTKSTSASFAFSADRAVARFECRVDPGQDGAWETCESPFDVSGLQDGDHQFQVRGVGAISGDGPVASHSWTVDTVAPGVSVTKGPAELTKETGARFEFASNDPNAVLSCRIDSNLAGDWQACESPRSLSGLPDGTHTFEVRALDSADNSAVASHTWTIDTVSPVVTFAKKPAASTTEKIASFEFRADKPGATFECATDGGAWKSCVSPAGTGPLAPGDHTFAVRATDRVGNLSAVVSHAWSVTEEAGPGPAEPAKPPVVNGMKKAKLDRAGKAKVATVFCAEGTCSVKAPKKLTVKIGKRKFKVKVIVPRSLVAGKTAPLRVKLPKAAVKAMAKRKLKAKIKITITSTNGESVARTIFVKLSGPKGGKKK